MELSPQTLAAIFEVALAHRDIFCEPFDDGTLVHDGIWETSVEPSAERGTVAFSLGFPADDLEDLMQGACDRFNESTPPFRAQVDAWENAGVWVDVVYVERMGPDDIIEPAALVERWSALNETVRHWHADLERDERLGIW